MLWLFGPILLLWLVVLLFFGVGTLIHLVLVLRHSSQSTARKVTADDGKINGIATFLDKRGLWVVRSPLTDEKVDRPDIAVPRSLLP
jgi:hypothetical protein